MAEAKIEDEVRLIAVMGATGAGKSSFINSVLGRAAALVDDGALSCTREVEGFLYDPPNGPKVLLVDSPGFNDFGPDGRKTDAQILQKIAAYLMAQYKEQKKFSGVVFIHNITSDASKSATRKNMAMFKNICGNEKMSNVVVVTTRWDQCKSSDGIQAEKSLMDTKGILKDIRDAGVPFYRAGHFTPANPRPFDSEYRSPKEVVESLLALEPVYLQLQEEIAEGKTIQRTTAGSLLHREFEDLKRDLNDRMDSIRKAVEDLELARKQGSDREQAHAILQQRLEDWDVQYRYFSDQWKNWEVEQKSSMATEIESLKAIYQQELNGVRTEFHEAHKKISTEVNNKLNETRMNTRLERSELWVECQMLRMRERQLHDDLNETRGTLARKTLDLNADRAKLLKEMNTLKSSLAEQAAEVEILKKEANAIPALHAQLAEATNARDRARAAESRANTELRRLQQTLRDSKKELNKYKAQVKEQDEELKFLVVEAENWTSEREFLVTEISRLETDLLAAQKWKKTSDAKSPTASPTSTGYALGFDSIQHQLGEYPSQPSFLAPEILHSLASPLVGPPSQVPEQELADLRRRVTRLNYELHPSRVQTMSEGRRELLEEEYQHLIHERIPELERVAQDRGAWQGVSGWSLPMPQPYL